MRILTSRCIRVRRSSALSIQSISEVLIPALLSGLFWFQLGGSETLTRQDVLDLSGLLFFQASVWGSCLCGAGKRANDSVFSAIQCASAHLVARL